MDYTATPKETALEYIAWIEKRYTSPKRRLEAISKEARFWYDYWKALHLTNEPEYMQALQTYDTAMRAYE